MDFFCKFLKWCWTNFFDLLTLISVILGWWLVHTLTIYRERKAEWRRFSSQIVTDIEKIEELALSYHKNKDRNIKLEEEIITKLDRINVKLQIISNNMKGVDFSKFTSFRKSILLNNFQTNKHSSFSYESDLIKNIINSANTLITMLYELK